MFRAAFRLLPVCLLLPLAGAAADDPTRLERDDAQWAMPAKNHAGTRFSGLDQVNAGNVGRLQVAWTFSTGLVHGHEAAPLVVNGTMYIVTPYPNYLYALDLTQPGAPLKWTYKPHPEHAAQGGPAATWSSGGVYVDGKIIYNTLDFKPPYLLDQGKVLGVSSWPPGQQSGTP